MRAAGIPVAIGTDASTCGDALNMFEAMRLACYLSRATSPDPARWLTAEETLRMATQGGARALGFAGRLGRIESGYKADIVLLISRASHICRSTIPFAKSYSRRTAPGSSGSWWAADG